MTTATDTISAADLEFIAAAAKFMESKSLAISMVNAVGRPLDAAVERLPEKARQMITASTSAALQRALSVAVRTLEDPSSVERNLSAAEDKAGYDLAGQQRTRRVHGFATAVAGGLGGLFGGWTIGIELPVTTTIMLRAIAQTAQACGEDLSLPATQMECMAVFAFGAPGKGDDSVESSYYAARLGLSALIKDAGIFLATKSVPDLGKVLAKKGAPPVLVRLLAAIAGRFGIVVSEKFVAQAVPVIGAAGGATLNFLFTEHFSKVAMYHFGLRRLEKQHGSLAVRAAYDAAAARLPNR